MALHDSLGMPAQLTLPDGRDLGRGCATWPEDERLLAVEVAGAGAGEGVGVGVGVESIVRTGCGVWTIPAGEGEGAATD